MQQIDTKLKMEILLKCLGDTSDQVADTLRKEGIAGYRKDSAACPVSNYLYKHFGRRYFVSSGQIVDRYTQERYPTTGAVDSFVYRFDQMEYLDLDLQTES